jgi:hypothetical protein
MKIVIGDFIKHKSFMDVCLEVKKVYDYGHGIEVSGIWWNLAYVNSFCINERQKINIAKTKESIKPESQRTTDLSEWEVLSKECRTDNCFRYSSWFPIKSEPLL